MPKTTLRVNSKRWEIFNKECHASFLRRDAYLSHVIPGELDILETIKPCDEVGSRWLKKNWSFNSSDDQTSSVAVNIEAPVLERLKRVCEEKLIPRDAFFNCFLEFITTRLFEPAVVIKNPRTKHDIASQLADAFNEWDEEEDEDNLRMDVMATAKNWRDLRNLYPLSREYYQKSLSIDKQYVDEMKALLSL